MPGTSSTGGNLVVLAAPDGPLAGVRDALRDLSAVGLIEEFLWVRLAPVDDQLSISADKIIDGAAYPVTVQQMLSERQYDRVRVCCLAAVLPSPAAPSRFEGQAGSLHDHPDGERELVDLIRRSSGTGEIERLRCVITRPGGIASAEDLGRDDWHNVIISPEDARGPGLGHQVLEPTDDPALLGGAAATAVAGLTGLWRGVPDAPLDDVAVPPGRSVRVGRAFFRSLDASAVEESIRDGVTSVAGGLPAVRVAGAQSLRIGPPPGGSAAGGAAGPGTDRIDDVDAATGTMADALWRKHGGVLRGPRVQPSPSPVKDIGALAALRMLFGFIWAAIKNTPMRWRAALTNKIASTTAAAVHGSVFGRAPSAYSVVVRGIRPDGSGADWRDWGRASNELAGVIGEAGGGQGWSGERHDLSTLWQDYLAGAYTLADGGERIAELPPLQVGADRAVLADPAQIVPGPAHRWQVPGQLGGAAVAPYDALGLQAVQTRLDPPEGQLTPELDRARSGLGGWLGRYRAAYAVKVGQRLGAAVSGTRDEAQAILRELAQAGSEDEPSDDLRRKMRRLTLWMRGLLIGLAVVIIILLLLGGFEKLTWETVTISIIAAVVLWLIGSFTVFFVSQRELFRELNRRKDAASQTEANRVNLGHVLRDLNRLTAAYEQFLAWSRISGVVLAAPFGGPAQVGAASRLPAAGLPLSTRIGVAELQPDAVAKAATVIRREVFRAGWLSRPWQALLESAPGRLGPEAIDLAQSPDRMFAEQGGDGTLLVRWAALLESGLAPATSQPGDPGRSLSLSKRRPEPVEGGRPEPAEGGRLDDSLSGEALNDGGRALWQAVGRSLPDSELGRSLVASVRVAGPTPATRPFADFMAGLDQPAESWSGQQFDPVAFGAEARVAGRQRVVTDWYRTSGRELSRVAVLVQLTEAFAAYELAAVPGAQARSGAPEAGQHPLPEVDEVF
ncbi:hypothetical protein [Microlunatus speluncae]|uniref:hypothetical protein n=1 Tax=Microlunatus speluncae TaxID=2594267 RepID=UPI0012662A90|nr:hypothetical protein [Microlunatus speluncae]